MHWVADEDFLWISHIWEPSVHNITVLRQGRCGNPAKVGWTMDITGEAEEGEMREMGKE